jgi:hypothetical protein
MEYAGWKDRKALTGALKPICTASNAIESLNRQLRKVIKTTATSQATTLRLNVRGERYAMQWL